MVRKFLFSSLLIVSCVSGVKAQDFTLMTKTLSQNTPGSPGTSWDNEAVKMFNWVSNKTQSPLVVHWQMLERTLPSGWFIYGICDNFICRGQNHPAVTMFAADSTNAIDVGDSSEIEPRIAVPASGGNGTGTIKIRLWTNNTTDTAVYLLTKNTTGVSVIKMDDNRVSIYPNPATNDLTVYADNNLNPAHISVLNIAGAQQITSNIERGKEVTSMNISSLAIGLYMVRVTDVNGTVITTRKFTKK